MKERIRAVINLAAALLLYPLAFAALIWIGWTGNPIWWGLIVLAGVLMIDQTIWIIIRSWFRR